MRLWSARSRTNDTGAVWLALIDGAVAGYVAICLGYSLEFGGRDAFIDDFFLRAEFRGKGWGRWTPMQVEAQAKQMGVQPFHLQVVAGNERAARLYRSAGYQPQDRLMLTKNLAA